MVVEYPTAPEGVEENLERRQRIIALLIVIAVIAFFIRASPHLFFIPQWSPEEEYNYLIVKELISIGSTFQIGSYPIFGHLIVFGIYTISGNSISPVVISQYINPVFGALTVIPLFFLIKKLSNEKTALLASIFWTFSETVFYRTSTFSSTEAIAFFLTISALYLYTRKKYVPASILIGLAFYTHLLPAVFAVLIIFTHQFYIRSIKIKVLSIISISAMALFLLSPFNPHQRLASVIEPTVLITHFNPSNIFLYSFSDILIGLSVFLGTVALGLLTIISLVKYKIQNKLVFSMLIVAFLVFVFSWIVYSPNIFAPPRLTFYFIIPLSFFASVLIVKSYQPTFIKYGVVALIVSLMLCSSIVGLRSMIWVQNSATNDEYSALDDLQNLGLLNINPSRWWSDYPIRISITSRASLTNPDMSINSAVNETDVINSSAQLADQNATLNQNTLFKYVFFSERMKKESFFTVYTDNRTAQIREPLHDIWSNSSIWHLIYYNYGVKVYEHK
jgi:asparagine N-glycosylation enzyme membrane subunit Stt3